MKWYLLATLAICVLLLIPVSQAENSECKVIDQLTGEILADTDCDIVPDEIDNCVYINNPNQEDYNNDNIGDACEQKTIVQAPSLRINAITSLDIVAGQVGSVYKIDVTNRGDHAVRTKLEIENLRDWGAFRIDPNPVLVINPKETETYYLYVSATSTASQGSKEFTATITSDSYKKEILMEAYIFPGDDKKITNNTKSVLEAFLIAIIVLILIVGLAIGYTKINKNE